jgi:predicted phage tail protein
MLRKVYLEGEIAEKFGSEFSMDVSTFKEAVSCFETNLEGFRDYMLECHEKGIGFTCAVEGKPLEMEEELFLKQNEGSFTIVAIPAGSKSALGKIFAAIAIIAVVYFTGGFAAGGWAMAAGGGLSLAGSMVVGLAINLAIAGIQQLMAPDPSTDGIQQDESYLFQGSGQTILEGDPVPILYGQLRIPGRPISFEIKNSERQFVDFVEPSEDWTPPQNNGDGGGGGGGGGPSPNDDKLSSPEFD